MRRYRLRRTAVFALLSIAASAWAAAQGWPVGSRACAADVVVPLVVAEAEEGPAITLPSPAATFGSFAEVSDAVTQERRRIAAIESRLQQLEKRSTTAAEPLPDPTDGAKADAEKTDAKNRDDTKKEASKKDDKKPEEPYEVGTDTAFKPKWKNAFEAETANKDFRVKIGGRTQVDASAFSAGPGPNQPPNQGGLDPGLADTVNLRRARFRIEGRMYEMYDWACEYDFVNQINVNNERFPTERDAGPLTAVTDLWMQVREVPILGTVRVGNQKDPYGYEHLTSSRWLNFMERSFSQDAFEGPFNNGFL
ncbi:MAG: hypothetical protein EBZ59_12710, partial [Planctomycetia bacterium]|nr:hypothetical protein [Planctomycetia bacterium]